jgi:hypothetical protein
MPPQASDPTVSRAKFDREITDFRSLADEHRRRGIFLLDAQFPAITILLAAPQLVPAAVVAAVLFDYTDYDFRPPSVRIINPFTSQPYTTSQLPIHLLRQAPISQGLQAGVLMAPSQMLPQDLLQSYGPDDIPFLCVAGVREYHDHPAHSGDAWELHRKEGAGRFARLLEIVETYGIRPLAGYNMNLIPQITGFTLKEIPK